MVDNIQEKVENKIIDLINFSAGGRVIIYKPENGGADLVVEKRGDYKKPPISLKIYDKNDYSKFESLDLDDNFYLIFAHFDMVKQDIEDEICIKDKKSKLLMEKNDLGKFLFEKFGK